MRRYERASTLLTSNRPVEDWGKLLGDSAAVTAMLDRLLHHLTHPHQTPIPTSNHFLFSPQ
jgi:DNA replication protein DnaC